MKTNCQLLVEIFDGLDRRKLGGFFIARTKDKRWIAAGEKGKTFRAALLRAHKKYAR